MALWLRLIRRLNFLIIFIQRGGAYVFTNGLDGFPELIHRSPDRPNLPPGLGCLLREASLEALNGLDDNTDSEVSRASGAGVAPRDADRRCGGAARRDGVLPANGGGESVLSVTRISLSPSLRRETSRQYCDLVSGTKLFIKDAQQLYIALNS